MKRRLAIPALGALLLAACNESLYPPREPTLIYNSAVDSLYFWPAPMRYARPGDTVSIRMRGLHLGYTCAKLTDIRWNWHDSTGNDFYTLRTTVEVPGNPACAIGGTFDSTFRVIFYSPGGEKLFVRRSNNVAADSLYFVSGFGHQETFTRTASDSDSMTITSGAYTFVFHDSGAARSRRYITAEMPICETFQSALFKRNSDSSITVRLRRLVASPLPAAAFPPCTGAHPDTIDVVPDLYNSF
jgi:hypothetical protein